MGVVSGFLGSLLQAVTILSLLGFALVARRSLRYPKRFRAVAVAVGAILAMNVAAPVLGLPVAEIGSAVAGIAAFCYAVANEIANRPGRRMWLAEAAAGPLILAAPFEGRWRAVAGGPDPGTNHHLIASDQRFAYDFVRSGAPSLGSTILAPVAGNVVAARDGRPDHRSSLRVVEDGDPLGNYVAIDSGDGVVFLCHLKHGSVAVRAGDRVAVGDPVGLCGNSGRTTKPHLHVHAQDLATYAFDRARGKPIAFPLAGSSGIVRAGAIVVGEPALRP